MNKNYWNLFDKSCKINQAEISVCKNYILL